MRKLTVFNKISVSYGRNFLFLNFFYFSIIKKKRIEIYNLFYKKIHPKKSETILDVGTTSSLDDHENLLITSYPFKSKISCLSNQSLNKFNLRYKEMKIYKGDGRKMSFKMNKFDYVISTATIEHVGSFNNQVKFIEECLRVSKKKLFITTPNRFFPIDFHTRLPFIHWLPKNIHRKILTILNENYLNKEKNLNLLCKKSIIKICNKINIQNYKIYLVKTFGLTSNLVLIISKTYQPNKLKGVKKRGRGGGSVVIIVL